MRNELLRISGATRDLASMHAGELGVIHLKDDGNSPQGVCFVARAADPESFSGIGKTAPARTFGQLHDLFRSCL